MRGLLLVGMCLGLVGCGESTAPRWDLVLVSVDTLRADRLPFYGSPRATAGNPEDLGSPAWLAKQGSVWENCWAPAGKTLPSLGTFWTGLDPLEHGGLSNRHAVLRRSFAEELQSGGFATHAAVANLSLGPLCGLAKGFDSYAVLAREREPQIPGHLLAKARSSISNGSPLLLWAHFMAPHQPYSPPSSVAGQWTDPAGPPGSHEILAGVHRKPETLTSELKGHLRGLYDEEVLAASLWVQELLQGLDSMYRSSGRGGLLDNAVVVFFSDHGEELGDRHGYFPHAKSLYSGVIRVPLVIAGPGRKAGTRIQEGKALGGVLPSLLAENAGSPEAFFSSWLGEYFAVREGPWTLVHNPGGDSSGPREPPRDVPYPYPPFALFDRRSDPLEQVDVAADHPEVVHRLFGLLDQWYRGLDMAEPGIPEGMDPAILAALGYPESLEAESRAPWPHAEGPR
jgi:hypothetical protein